MPGPQPLGHRRGEDQARCARYSRDQSPSAQPPPHTAKRVCQAVSEPLLPHPVPPVIAAGPLELVVLEGLEALLPCAARGVPEPRVSWSREGALLRAGRATVLPSGELLLRDVQVSAVPSGRCEVGVLRNKCFLALKSIWLLCESVWQRESPGQSCATGWRVGTV